MNTKLAWKWKTVTENSMKVVMPLFHTSADKKGAKQMKIKDLAPIMSSTRGNVVFTTIYDTTTQIDLCSGASIEYAIEKYGEKEIKKMYPISSWNHGEMVIEI